MANSETIKAAIDANINTNGNQEITGAVMNSVLKQMVDSTDAQLAKLSERMIILTGMGVGTTSAGVTKVGDYYYNTRENAIKKCVTFSGSSGTYEVVPFSYDTFYKLGEAVYYYNGVTIVPFNDPIAPLLDKRLPIKDVKVSTHAGYVTSDGFIGSSSLSIYTDNIPLVKGDVILVGGYANGVPVISVVLSDGSLFPCVFENRTLDDDELYTSGFKYYSFEAAENCEVVLSARKERFQYYVIGREWNPNDIKAMCGGIPSYIKDDFENGCYNITDSVKKAEREHQKRFSFSVKENDVILYYGFGYGEENTSFAVTDSLGQVILKSRTSYISPSLADSKPPYVIVIPKGGVTIYLNLYDTVSNADVYHVGKDNKGVRMMLRDLYSPVLAQQDLISGYYPMGGEYIEGLTSSSNLLCGKVDVKEGESFIIKGKSYGLNSRTYAIADSEGRILERADALSTSDLDDEPICVTIPSGGVALYVNNYIYKYQSSEEQNNFLVAKSLIPKMVNTNEGVAKTKLELLTRPMFSTWDSYAPSNPSLCWVKSIKKDNSLPFDVGYFFSDYPAKTGKIYYAESLMGELKEVCDFAEFNGMQVRDKVVAVSPKHNSILASVFDVFPGKGVAIYEDGAYSLLNFDEPMQGWLYNFGIEFLTDENGEEFCLYGEYSHARKSSRRIFKGKYPYSQKENWKVVFTIPSQEGVQDNILHIHHIQKDPWSKYIYCCCGDTAAESRWFYSGDNGETWNLLVKDMPQGYLRCTSVVFTDKEIWWASDDNAHFLMNAQRNESGLLDVNTIIAKCSLTSFQSTNAIAYIKKDERLFFYDRSDLPELTECYYDIKKNELVEVGTFVKMGDQSEGFPWGNRGRCYVRYPNTSEPLLAMGIVEEYKPCQFDIIGNDEHTFGSIFYTL